MPTALKDATAQTGNTINGWTSETSYAGTTLKVLPDDAARGANLTSYTTLGNYRRVELGRGAEERLRGDIHQPRLDE